MSERSTAPAALIGIPVALGIALAGWFVGNAVFRARASERSVTVKGFSEREVRADLALWPVVFTVTAEDLATLQRRVEESAGRVEAFLRKDFAAEEISQTSPRITDREAQRAMPSGRPMERYSAEAVLTVRTGKIDAVRSANARAGELVAQGVALIRSYEYNTQYLFTALEKIKPEMIAEATLDARRAAEQFAKDSGSRVGAIRGAQQGLFSVEDRDAFSPQFKKVRVVTTIQFFLED